MRVLPSSSFHNMVNVQKIIILTLLCSLSSLSPNLSIAHAKRVRRAWIFGYSTQGTSHSSPTPKAPDFPVLIKWTKCDPTQSQNNVNDKAMPTIVYPNGKSQELPSGKTHESIDIFRLTQSQNKAWSLTKTLTEEGQGGGM